MSSYRDDWEDLGSIDSMAILEGLQDSLDSDDALGMDSLRPSLSDELLRRMRNFNLKELCQMSFNIGILVQRAAQKREQKEQVWVNTLFAEQKMIVVKDGGFYAVEMASEPEAPNASRDINKVCTCLQSLELRQGKRRYSDPKRAPKEIRKEACWCDCALCKSHGCGARVCKIPDHEAPNSGLRKGQCLQCKQISQASKARKQVAAAAAGDELE